MILVNRGREAAGELWQERFFDPAPSYEYLCGGAAPCPGYSKGVQQEGGVHSLEPGKSGASAEMRGLAMVQRERILRREYGGTRARVWIDD